MFGRRELIEKLAVFLGIAVAAKASTTAHIAHNPGGDDALLAEMKSAAIAIREQNLADKRSASDELDQLRVQLAGCGVAASGWNQDPATQGQYGWSASYQDVLELRRKFDAAIKIIAARAPVKQDTVLYPCGCSATANDHWFGIAANFEGGPLGRGPIIPHYCAEHGSPVETTRATIIHGENWGKTESVKVDSLEL